MKKIALGLVIIVAVLLSIGPLALANGPGEVYVDPSYDGNEDGTQEKPYDTEAEGRAYLQSLPEGGTLYIRNEDGTWSGGVYVAAVASGGSGALLPQTVLYLLLAVVALALGLTGLRLIRRSAQVGD